MPTCKKGHADVNEYNDVPVESPAGKKAKFSFKYCGECDDLFDFK